MPRRAISGLSLKPPCTLRYGEKTTRVGPTLYLAIEAIRRCGGSCPAPVVCRAVWGQPAVKPETLWSLAHRVSAKLRAVGCPGRCAVDEGHVLIC